MTLLYQVDFRTLASQLSLSPGAKTIDALTWYLKGNGSAAFGASLVNGSGLRIQHVSGTPSGIGSSGDLNEPHWCLPLANVPGYLTNQALLVRGRMVRNSGNPNVTPLLGLVDTTSDSTGLRAAQRAKDHLIGPAFTTTVTQSLTLKFGISTPTTGTGRTTSIANNECVPGILNNHLSGWAVHGSEHQPSAIPTSIASFLPGSGSTSSTTGDPNFQWTSRGNPCVLFGFNSQSGSWIVDLQWLRIDVIGEVLDATAPRIENISPAPGGALGKYQPITFDLVGQPFSLREFLVRFGSGKTYHQVHDGSSFVEDFAVPGFSSLTTIADGYTFSIRRPSAWPSGKVALRALVVDGGGNMVVIDA